MFVSAREKGKKNEGLIIFQVVNKLIEECLKHWKYWRGHCSKEIDPKLFQRRVAKPCFLDWDEQSSLSHSPVEGRRLSTRADELHCPPPGIVADGRPCACV